MLGSLIRGCTTWTGQGRIRWAAIGAAVAVTLGAGGIGVVRATVSSGPKPIFVSITPCRLVDTRPAPTTVGTRATPLNPAETATFTVHGTNGNCTIPAGAVAIDANVTITAPTSDGFLTMFPADAALPNASNLNWSAGQAPTPNAVTVDLSADGKVNVFNERGTVNVIIDIVGYYEDHNHDDRYLQRGDIVVSHPARSYVQGENPSATFLTFTTRVRPSGDGQALMPLDAPTDVAGIAYRLSSIEYCIYSIVGGGVVTERRRVVRQRDILQHDRDRYHRPRCHRLLHGCGPRGGGCADVGVRRLDRRRRRRLRRTLGRPVDVDANGRRITSANNSPVPSGVNDE